MAYNDYVKGQMKRWGPAWEADPSNPNKTTGIISPAIYGMKQGVGDFGTSEARRVEMEQQPKTWGLEDARARDQAYIDLLKNRAAGNDLDATRMGAQQRAGSRGDLLSFMASRGGGAAQARDAQYGIGQASQGIRGQEAVAAEQEQQAYRDRLAEEQARQWGSESGEASRNQGWMLGQELNRQGALGMGLDDTYNIARQREQAYEQQKKQKLMGKQVRAGLAAEEAAADAGAQKVAADLGVKFLTMGIASDIRSKKNIQPAQSEARALLQALSQSEDDERVGAELGARPGRDLLKALAMEGPKKWQYKSDQGLGTDDQHFGPMAQTLEKAGPAGQAMVGKDEKGMRYIKGDQALTGMLAAMAEQQRQIDQMRVATGEQRRERGVLGAVPAGRGEPIGGGFAPSRYEMAEQRPLVDVLDDPAQVRRAQAEWIPAQPDAPRWTRR